MKTIIYHNPNCSKSRKALAILQECHLDIEIIEYLKLGLSKSEIQSILKKLDCDYIDIIRQKEPEFLEFVIEPRDEEQCLEALTKYPQLLERPIVIHNGRAVIARPPENIYELLN